MTITVEVYMIVSKNTYALNYRWKKKKLNREI